MVKRAPDLMLMHRHGGGALPDPELVEEEDEDDPFGHGFSFHPSNVHLPAEHLFDNYDLDDPETFWQNLDDTLPDQELPSSDGALAEFSLFEHPTDKCGICTAMLDTLTLIEDGQVSDVALCLKTVEEVLGSMSCNFSVAPVAANRRVASLRASVLQLLD